MTKKNRFKVQVKKRGVLFTIGNQGFWLGIDLDDYSPSDKLKVKRWYARQLTIALKRLQG